MEAEQGGYVARKHIWDHLTQKLKEVERLKFEEPKWSSMLPDMFSDVAINWGSMLGTAFERNTEERDSEDSPVRDSPSLATSGSRKRGRSGATKSTADSPSKKVHPTMSEPSSSRSTKTKTNDGETTKALTQLSEKQHQRNQEQREAYLHCLELVVDCGIDEASEEY